MVLPKISVSIPGCDNFEVPNLSVRLKPDPSLPTPYLPVPDEDDDVVFLGVFCPSSPDPADISTLD